MKKIFLYLILLITINVSAQVGNVDLRPFIGREIVDQKVLEYFSKFNDPSMTEGISYHLSFKNEGITLMVNNNNGRISSIFLENNVDSTLQYKGHIPYGVTFSDNRSDLIQKLGHADWTVVGDTKKYEWDSLTKIVWDRIGVTVIFSNNSIISGNPYIESICLTQPDPNWEEGLRLAYKELEERLSQIQEEEN